MDNEDETEATLWRRSLGLDEQTVAEAGKRCGVQWPPWMGDWFTSLSPRNDNNNAEGPWDHWVDLAILILRDPLTAIVRPEAHAVASELQIHRFYSEANRRLTDEELMRRFREPVQTAAISDS